MAPATYLYPRTKFICQNTKLSSFPKWNIYNVWCSVKNYHTKRQEKITCTEEEEPSIETDEAMTQMMKTVAKVLKPLL